MASRTYVEEAQGKPMDSRFNRQPFSVHAAFVVTKPFVMDGEQYVRGDAVPTDGIEPRRLRQMWDNRMIDAAPAMPQAAPAGAAKRVQERSNESSVPVASTQPETAPEAAQGGFKVEHRGFGRYWVLDAAGGEVAGPMSREEATSMAREAA